MLAWYNLASMEHFNLFSNPTPFKEKHPQTCSWGPWLIVSCICSGLPLLFDVRNTLCSRYLMLVGPKHSLSSLRNCQERFPDDSVTMYTIFFEDSSYSTSWYCSTGTRYEFSAYLWHQKFIVCTRNSFYYSFMSLLRYRCWILIL